MAINEKISVVVPVYNVEEYLDQCVESLVGQTYKNLEVILVDDGSPDNCPAMCDEWAERDNRIKVSYIRKTEGFRRQEMRRWTLLPVIISALLIRTTGLNRICMKYS